MLHQHKQVVTLIVTDMSPEVARLVLEFLYTDTLRRRLHPESPVLVELPAAAREYQLPRLRSICDAVLAGQGRALQPLDPVWTATSSTPSCETAGRPRDYRCGTSRPSMPRPTVWRELHTQPP